MQKGRRTFFQLVVRYVLPGKTGQMKTNKGFMEAISVPGKAIWMEPITTCGSWNTVEAGWFKHISSTLTLRSVKPQT